MNDSMVVWEKAKPENVGRTQDEELSTTGPKFRSQSHSMLTLFFAAANLLLCDSTRDIAEMTCTTPSKND